MYIVAFVDIIGYFPLFRGILFGFVKYNIKK